MNKLLKQQWKEARQAFLESIYITEADIHYLHTKEDQWFLYDNPKEYGRTKVWLPSELCTLRNYKKYIDSKISLGDTIIANDKEII